MHSVILRERLNDTYDKPQCISESLCLTFHSPMKGCDSSCPRWPCVSCGMTCEWGRARKAQPRASHLSLRLPHTCAAPRWRLHSPGCRRRTYIHPCTLYPRLGARGSCWNAASVPPSRRRVTLTVMSMTRSDVFTEATPPLSRCAAVIFTTHNNTLAVLHIFP